VRGQHAGRGTGIDDTVSVVVLVGNPGIGQCRQDPELRAGALGGLDRRQPGVVSGVQRGLARDAFGRVDLQAELLQDDWLAELLAGGDVVRDPLLAPDDGIDAVGRRSSPAVADEC
jgi:hypothetical protein